MSAGDWALLILAIFWAILVIVIAIVSARLLKVIDSTRETIDGLRKETVPLLSEVRTTVTSVNRNLVHTEEILASATTITKNVERVSTLVDRFVSLPLIKAISWGHGIQKGVRRFRGET